MKNNPNWGIIKESKCLGQNSPFRAKILNSTGLGQKYPIECEISEMKIFRSKNFNLGRKLWIWGVKVKNSSFCGENSEFEVPGFSSNPFKVYFLKMKPFKLYKLKMIH